MHLVITIHLIDENLVLNLHGCLLRYQQRVVVAPGNDNLTAAAALQQMLRVGEACDDAYRSRSGIDDTACLDNCTFVVIGRTVSQQQAYTRESLDGIGQSIVLAAQIQYVGFGHREVDLHGRSIADRRHGLGR